MATSESVSKPSNATSALNAGGQYPLPLKRASWWSALGPGLITGAADDDPSGIATYSQVGAQYGYGLGWIMVFSYPLMAVTQVISARIGCVTGKGIARNIRAHYPPAILRVMVLLLLVANIANLGADLGAMGSALQLLIGGPALVYAVAFGVVCVVLEIFVPYDRYASVLKWLTLSLFFYVAVVFFAHVPWGTALVGTLVPHIVLDKDHATAIVAVLGTTISPYLFFWQASQEVEEQVRHRSKPLYVTPAQAGPEFKRMRIDTWVGMGISNIIAIFIIYATAATLNAHGVTDVQSTAQAAEALRPAAGAFAFFVFAAGIIGTGMLAVPVLAGSAAYAVCETFGWEEGLDRKLRDARAFYAVIAVATLLGLTVNFIGIDPIKALYWSAVLNGLLAAPLMAMMLLIANNRKIMGDLVLSRSLTVVGWMATAVMLVATVAFLAL